MIRFAKEITDDIHRRQIEKKNKRDEKGYINGEAFERWLKARYQVKRMK